jgi:signal transduction histidine kinase
MSLVRMEAGLVASVEAVLDELITHFTAGRAVLALEEEGSERILLWEVSRDEPGRRKTVRPLHLDRAQARAYLFPIPDGVGAWHAGRSTRAADATPMRTAAIDLLGRRVAERPSLEPLADIRAPWRSVHGLSSIAGTGWTGRLLIFDGSASHNVEDDLRFLQTVVRQVAPALFNLYLQRRLHSRVGVAERARVARKLHDGIIQSLVGFEMQLDVMCRTAGGTVPPATVDQLAAIQRVLGDEIHNVRDLMQLLRPLDVSPKELIPYLSDLVERFEYRTGIQARFVCDVDEITLPPRVCRELAGAIQEALTNVRKHSGARSVQVRVAATENHWQFMVDDDGRGFDFDGRLTHEELDARRCGPAMLKERLRAIGASLTIDSRRGQDARLEISIPRLRHA